MILQEELAIIEKRIPEQIEYIYEVWRRYRRGEIDCSRLTELNSSAEGVLTNLRRRRNNLICELHGQETN